MIGVLLEPLNTLMLTTDLTTGLFPVANVTWHSHSPGQKIVTKICLHAPGSVSFRVRFLLCPPIKQRQLVNLNQVLLERSVFCGRDKDIAPAINVLFITTFGHAPLFL